MKQIFKREKIIIRSFIICSIFCCQLISLAQDISVTQRKLRLVADAIVKDATFGYVDQNTGNRYSSLDKMPNNVRLRLESPYTDWRYWNGVLNIAMLNASEVLHESAYAEFARKNVAFGFDSYKYFESTYKNEGKWNFPFGQFFIMEELDDCGAIGASVIEVNRTEKQTRYKEYIERASKHILSRQSRLNDGTLVRSFPHQWTLWADDLYMGLSFTSRMGEVTGDAKYFDDAAQQVINFHKYLFNENAGLMYHCWYSDIDRHGVAMWGRANGWALVAQVELLDRLPKNHPKRDTLLMLLQRHIVGISRYQSGSGLWHQLLDKTDSYLETSCSAMFVYAVARSIKKGYIEDRYASIALRGWEGVLTKIRPDGQVEGVCAGTATSDDLVHYYNRPTPLNDIHGIGAIILAGVAVMQINEKSNVH